MSKISITPNASGTGVFTISSPATSTDRTLTLPDEAGTVLTSASSIPTSALTGNIIQNAGPAFSVYSSVSQTGISSSTWTKMTFNTEEYDTDGCFASSTFTPNVAGYYSLNTNVLSDTLMTGRILLSIYKNGASFKQIAGLYASSARLSPSGSVLVYANGTTDYFEVWAYSDAGAWTTNGGVGANWFTGVMVRAA